jgi:hypothetical protein
MCYTLYLKRDEIILQRINFLIWYIITYSELIYKYLMRYIAI